MKLNRWLIGTIIGAQFAFNSFAADSADTNRDTDIEALKQHIRELGQKVQTLEQQGEADKQSTADAVKQQNQDLDQKVRILARQRELDQDAAVEGGQNSPKATGAASGLRASSAGSQFRFSVQGAGAGGHRNAFSDC